MNAPETNINVICAGILVADIFVPPISGLPEAGELCATGDFLIDSGGCAANTATCLAKLGIQAAVAGKVGSDLFGDFIAQDLADLTITAPDNADIRFSEDAAAFDLPEALGWLYVVEGSNLGAAFLLKDAAKLGLDETFGARHLAGAPEGRGLHWKTFVAALDAVELTADEENRMISGAEAAFHAVHGHARRMMS